MNSDITRASDPEPADEADRSAATPESTREAIIRSTGSGYAPVRHVFVQKHEGKSRASTLGRLVKERKRRELILYLLVLTAWDADQRRSPWPAAVWLRALTVRQTPNLTWSRSSLSETWTSLVKLKLITRRRELRRSRITPRREDRKDVYLRPDGQSTENLYFTLPGEFWTNLWFDRLSLAGVAVLLILLKETNREAEFHLTYAETASWYGVSETTAKKGYKELVAMGLADYRDDVRRSNYTEDGLTTKRYYRLLGAFSTQARADVREQAAKERMRRRRKSKAGVRKPKITRNKAS